MTIQKDNPDKREEAAELAAIQRNSVTIPADKLAELQRKAKLVDELVEALENLFTRVDQDYDVIKGDWWSDERDAARKAIAKAKEQSCSTLCHPEEECFITENGKCKAKGE